MLRVHPQKQHVIAGCSESALNKPLPFQETGPVFETKYSTVSSISNNAVQQFCGNLMTRSGDCLHTHCCATAQTAAEFSKDHWLFLHLVLFSAQKDKLVFSFLCISLIHLSFVKRSSRSFFRQAVTGLRPPDL